MHAMSHYPTVRYRESRPVRSCDAFVIRDRREVTHEECRPKLAFSTAAGSSGSARKMPLPAEELHDEQLVRVSVVPSEGCLKRLAGPYIRGLPRLLRWASYFSLPSSYMRSQFCRLSLASCLPTHSITNSLRNNEHGRTLQGMKGKETRLSKTHDNDKEL